MQTGKQWNSSIWCIMYNNTQSSVLIPGVLFLASGRYNTILMYYVFKTYNIIPCSMKKTHSSNAYRCVHGIHLYYVYGLPNNRIILCTMDICPSKYSYMLCFSDHIKIWLYHTYLFLTRPRPRPNAFKTEINRWYIVRPNDGTNRCTGILYSVIHLTQRTNYTL